MISVSATSQNFGTPRNYVGLCQIGQELFEVGGRSSLVGGILRSIEKYSIASNQWFTVGEGIVEERSGAGVTALNGKIYVVGGYLDIFIFHLYPC